MPADGAILTNQESILSNHERILANQGSIEKNQSKFGKIAANPASILANQQVIRSNQESILGNHREFLDNQKKLLQKYARRGGGDGRRRVRDNGFHDRFADQEPAGPDAPHRPSSPRAGPCQGSQHVVTSNGFESRHGSIWVEIVPGESDGRLADPR